MQLLIDLIIWNLMFDYAVNEISLLHLHMVLLLYHILQIYDFKNIKQFN